MRSEAIKILEQNTGSNLFDINRSKFFLYTYIWRQGKQKQKLGDFIKIKSFYIAKETINKTKRKPTEWEKTFANDISNKGLASKIYKELTQLNTQKTNNLI